MRIYVGVVVVVVVVVVVAMGLSHNTLFIPEEKFRKMLN